MLYLAEYMGITTGICQRLNSHKCVRLQQTDDLTLHSILNHIAYVNRAALPNQSNMAVPAPTSRKSQLQKVLKGTYTTALLGLMLCVSDMGRLCGPYGLMAPVTNSTGMAPVSTPENNVSSWSYFLPSMPRSPSDILSSDNRILFLLYADGWLLRPASAGWYGTAAMAMVLLPDTVPGPWVCNGLCNGQHHKTACQQPTPIPATAVCDFIEIQATSRVPLHLNTRRQFPVQDRHTNCILKHGFKYWLGKTWQELIIAEFTWRMDFWLV